MYEFPTVERKKNTPPPPKKKNSREKNPSENEIAQNRGEVCKGKGVGGGGQILTNEHVSGRGGRGKGGMQQHFNQSVAWPATKNSSLSVPPPSSQGGM